ncbi:MAG: hypothetical protein JWL85_506 [Candidatus Saccharibacteria bacterium]|nr:hypothetical protein [Candidatus Saccharibacteria bacterium]
MKDGHNILTRHWYLLIFTVIITILAILVAPGLVWKVHAQSAPSFNVNNVSIRLGQPKVLRGPAYFDSPLSQYKDSLGVWHSFFEIGGDDEVGGWTRAVTGSTQDAISGTPSPAIAKTDCGNWMFNTQKVGSNLIALVHHEDNCDYRANSMKTNKSMRISASTDNGATWTNWGTIISGVKAPTSGQVTGDGDCQFIDGHDGYLYAYCLQSWDYETSGWVETRRTIVARAPSWSIGPGSWYKYNGMAWGSAGLAGGADLLAGVGGEGKGVGYWTPQNRVMLIGGEVNGDSVNNDGVTIYFSDNKVDFTKLNEPLISYNDTEQVWDRSLTTPSPLLSYFSLANNGDGYSGSPADGSNNVGDQFALWYRYTPPGSKIEENSYFVKQTVYLTYLSSPPPFQVGNALTTWEDTSSGQLRSTIGPVEGAWGAVDDLGFMMTKAPAGASSIQVDECKYGSDWYAVPTSSGCGGGIVRTRSLGWVYTTQQANTDPLYRCVNASSKHFLSNTSNCDAKGTMEYLLGYIPNS